MDAGSVLGVPALRPAFLVDLPAAKPREGQAGRGARIMMIAVTSQVFTKRLHLKTTSKTTISTTTTIEDEDDDERRRRRRGRGRDAETWQVCPCSADSAKGCLLLDFGLELPRLAVIFQLS